MTGNTNVVPENVDGADRDLEQSSLISHQGAVIAEVLSDLQTSSKWSDMQETNTAQDRTAGLHRELRERIARASEEIERFRGLVADTEAEFAQADESGQVAMLATMNSYREGMFGSDDTHAPAANPAIVNLLDLLTGFGLLKYRV